MRVVQVVARYDESCAVMRDKNLDPELLTDRQQSLKAASMPVHQERVLVHRHAELASTSCQLQAKGYPVLKMIKCLLPTKCFSACICNHPSSNPVLPPPFL